MNENDEYKRVSKLASEFGVCMYAVTTAEELLFNCIPEYTELTDDLPVKIVQVVARYVNKCLVNAYEAGYEEGRADAIAEYYGGAI